MKEILFEELKNREEHWSKSLFKEKGLAISDVARALDLSYAYVCGMLNGAIKVTEEQEERITELMNYLNQ